MAEDIRLFLLDGHTVVPVDSLAQWQAGMRDAAWEVACTTLDDQTVFTRFVGSLTLHHPGQPLWLFQTCHANPRAETVTVIERYTTWDAAEAGHARIAAALQDSLDLQRETRPPDISV